MNELRKLKRGLKDLSPLFAQKTLKPISLEMIGRPLQPETQIQGLHTLGIFNPGSPKDALPLGAALASKLCSPQTRCHLISIKTLIRDKEMDPLEVFGSFLKHATVSWRELKVLGDIPSSYDPDSLFSDPSGPQGEVIFFDCEDPYVSGFGKWLSVLDRCLFVMEPAAESLMASYRLMKWISSLSHALEFDVVFKGSSEDSRGEDLFEQFSLMASRHLGISLFWRGSVYLPSHGYAMQLNLDIRKLLRGRLESRPPLMRQALIHFVHGIMKAPGSNMGENARAVKKTELFFPPVQVRESFLERGHERAGLFQKLRLTPLEIEALMELGISFRGASLPVLVPLVPHENFEA